MKKKKRFTWSYDMLVWLGFCVRVKPYAWSKVRELNESVYFSLTKLVLLIFVHRSASCIIMDIDMHKSPWSIDFRSNYNLTLPHVNLTHLSQFFFFFFNVVRLSCHGNSFSFEPLIFFFNYRCKKELFV